MIADIDKARMLVLHAHRLVDKHAHRLGGIRYLEWSMRSDAKTLFVISRNLRDKDQGRLFA